MSIKTTSLELSKQLKENGFPQESKFWYVNTGEDQNPENYILVVDAPTSEAFSEAEMYAAPTAEEILDLLPVYAQFEKESLPFEFRMHKAIGGEFPDEYEIFYCRYRRIITDKEDNYQERGRCWSESLAEAAGKCWLYLKKEGLL